VFKNKRWMIVIGSVGALALLLGVVGVAGVAGVAHAQTQEEDEGSFPPHGEVFQGGGPFGGGRFGGRMSGGPMNRGEFQGGPLHRGLEAVADTLGLTEEELVEALRDGTSVAELAEEQGVDLDDIVSDVLAEAEERLEEAVENGRLTEDQKSQMLERLADDLPQHFSEPWEPRGPQRGLFGQFSESFWSRYDAVSEVLGLDPEELFSELHDGKSVAEVADEQGVPVDEIREALEAARAEMMEERIRQAVESGRITEERAEWMLEGLENDFLPRERGLGRGPGGGPGCGGRGRGRGW